MNPALSSSLLDHIDMAPRDPILGMNEAFNADHRPSKINLSIGVYCDNTGKVPLLKCVREAEVALLAQHRARSYLPIDGLAAYNQSVQHLVFGADSAAVQERRVITVQALGGTGALKLGADFLKHFCPTATQVWISDPTWENHRAVFEMAGFAVHTYPYYDAATHGVDFANMLATLKQIPAYSIVVLHACCHNPTGADLSFDQWTAVIQICIERGLIPFIDMAYQGFGDGLIEDAHIIRRFAEAGGLLLVSHSFSKSFSLYGERVGALHMIVKNSDLATRALSQMKRVIRTNYSNPPTHGSQIVSMIFASSELRQLWEAELKQMRERIRAMRQLLVNQLQEKKPTRDFHFMLHQRGMFSYSGLTAEHATRLRHEFSIYILDTGRICVAALNEHNMDVVVNAIVAVI